MEKTNKPTRRRVAKNTAVRFFLQTNCAQGYPVAQAKSKLFFALNADVYTVYRQSCAPHRINFSYIFDQPDRTILQQRTGVPCIQQLTKALEKFRIKSTY
jgi:hypothetical protein